MKNQALVLLLVSLLASSVLSQEPVDEREPPGSHGGHHKTLTCPDGQYHDYPTHSCLECHPICKTCSGFKLNCQTCAEGYHFDPIAKSHCLKSGWAYNKFHHLEEIIHHFIPDHIKAYQIHRLFNISGVIWWFIISILVFVSLGVGYCCMWVHYKRTRGININEMYLSDVIDMAMGRPQQNYQYQHVFQGNDTGN